MGIGNEECVRYDALGEVGGACRHHCLLDPAVDYCRALADDLLPSLVDGHLDNVQDQKMCS